MQDDFDLDLFLQELGIDLSEDAVQKETIGIQETYAILSSSAPEALPAYACASEDETPPNEIDSNSDSPARLQNAGINGISDDASKKECPSSVSSKSQTNTLLKEKQNALFRSAPFFAALLLLTIIAWALPLRPTISESEKRSLKTFPEFSTDALFSGDYFSGIDDWFSDTFTFREKWIRASNTFKSFYGMRTVAIYSNAGGNAAPATQSEPKLSNEAIQNIETEEFAVQETEGIEPEAATEPEEVEPWGGVVVDDDDFVSEDYVLVINNAAFKYTGCSDSYCDLFVDLVNSAGDALEGKANFYLSLVPENATSVLSPKDRKYYGFQLEEEIFDRIYSQCNDSVKTVNVIPNLQSHNGEYIVFRTDHHWTALGAYYAYESWCETAGVDPVPLSQYKEYVWEGFLGSYFYSTGELKNLGDTPDTVYAYEPPGKITLYQNFSNSDSMGGEAPLILDRTTSMPGAKYMTFIGADQCRATFVNEDITDGSAVMVIKTSFGNPYVYYLTQHYQYVYVVDYRYYGGRGLTSFVERFDVGDVILCAGLGFVAEEGGYNLLKTYLK